MRGDQWEATINETTINNGQQGSKLPSLSILKFLYWWSEENHSIKFCLRQINMTGYNSKF